MGLPNYKDIIELVKAGATIEAQEKIMELRQNALEMGEENIRLRNLVSELEAQIRNLQNADGEPCPSCRKKTWIVQSSRPDGVFGMLGGMRRTYKCTNCGFTEESIASPK